MRLLTGVYKLVLLGYSNRQDISIRYETPSDDSVIYDIIAPYVLSEEDMQVVAKSPQVVNCHWLETFIAAKPSPVEHALE